MRFLFAALVGLILFAANANAQCQCSTGGACQCGPGCICTQPISTQAGDAISDGWHPLSNFPGQHGLFQGGKQIGVLCEGQYYARVSKGVFADDASKPPLAFPVASRPVMQFAPTMFMGGCAGGSCGGGR